MELGAGGHCPISSPIAEGDTITEDGNIYDVIMFPCIVCVEWVLSSLALERNSLRKTEGLFFWFCLWVFFREVFFLFVCFYYKLSDPVANEDLIQFLLRANWPTALWPGE